MDSTRLEEYADVKCNEPMKFHTTYRIGGKVDYFISPKSVVALMRIVNILNEEEFPYFVLGRGSNVLFSDDDFHGAIINLDKNLNDCYFEEDGTVIAQAGCSIIRLANESMKHGLSGLEFASGIPGSVGGALYMNAGAYKSDVSQILVDVCVLKDNTLKWMPKEELDYAYRHSIFQSHREWTIVAARFQLEKKDKEEILELMNSRKERRITSQPLNKPCAGSTFRNPESMPAWKIIDELGYRGLTCGGAQVSEKHSNFIVNQADAKAMDVYTLIRDIKAKAKEVYDIDLITEVEFINWNL